MPGAKPKCWPITGELLADFDPKAEDDAEVLRMTRKWARLSLFAVTGMLTQMHGSVLEAQDVDLVQQVAYVADGWASEALHRFGRKAVA